METASNAKFLVLEKFVALAKAGADPEGPGSNGSVLDYAKRYRKKLQRSLVRLDSEYDCRILEMNRTIKYLEHYKRTKCWPEMSSSLDADKLYQVPHDY